jgi:hypothetical protein
MGREGQWIKQPVDEPIDVANWETDDEFSIYPEGARDKTLFYSPLNSQCKFLIPNHRYLYKYCLYELSPLDKPPRHPDQFWTEIIAYHIGCLLGIPVPPAFVAFNEKDKTCGALIEWFLNYPEQNEKEYFIAGGDIMLNFIPSYDRKKGQQHHFAIIERYLGILEKSNDVEMAEWQFFWCDMLLFDALIGNTDRHQDNWGLLLQQIENSVPRIRMAPVFDNGTSLGYEILESKMADFFISNRMQKYIDKGRHHIRYQLNDKQPAQHIELLVWRANKHPAMLQRMKDKLTAFDITRLKSTINHYTGFNIRIPLTEKRADFVYHLIESRYLAIREKIEKLP